MRLNVESSDGMHIVLVAKCEHEVLGLVVDAKEGGNHDLGSQASIWKKARSQTVFVTDLMFGMLFGVCSAMLMKKKALESLEL